MSIKTMDTQKRCRKIVLFRTTFVLQLMPTNVHYHCPLWHPINIIQGPYTPFPVTSSTHPTRSSSKSTEPDPSSSMNSKRSSISLSRSCMEDSVNNSLSYFQASTAIIMGRGFHFDRRGQLAKKKKEVSIRISIPSPSRYESSLLSYKNYVTPTVSGLTYTAGCAGFHLWVQV